MNTLKIARIIDLLNENEIEIVSYGLAPNPSGFCYELMNDDTPIEVLKELNTLLDSLNTSEVSKLRKMLF